MYSLPIPFVLIPYSNTIESSNTFVSGFRWTKLRAAMCPHTILLEPLSECMLLGCVTAWAVNFLFRWDPIFFFLEPDVLKLFGVCTLGKDFKNNCIT